MTPEAVLSNAPKVLTQAQREAYFRDGYVALEEFVSREWLDRLWDVTDGFIAESKSVSKSDDKFDVEPDHNADNPRLRRLSWPVSHHGVYWVPSFQVEFQMVRRRGRGQMAPGFSLLSTQQCLCSGHWALHVRCGRGNGAARCHPG